MVTYEIGGFRMDVSLGDVWVSYPRIKQVSFGVTISNRPRIRPQKRSTSFRILTQDTVNPYCQETSGWF